MKVKIEDIKKLREKTDAGISDCRLALEEANGKWFDKLTILSEVERMDAAMKILRKKGIERAEKKAEREVKAGQVFSYVHHTGRVASLVALACETDFVAKTDEFQKLGKELAMQVAASKPGSVEKLLDEEYMRDPGKKIRELIKEVIGKLGENIQVVDFSVKSI